VTDPSVHHDPVHFDSYRSYKLRQQPGNESKYQFVSYSNNHISFGHGTHSCAGRFYTSSEIKVVMVHLLLQSNFRFPGDQGKSEMLSIGADKIPNPQAKILN
jgi:cytochrome P450